jgi:hypothetical protein
MSQPKVRFLIPLIVFTGAAFLFAGCWQCQPGTDDGSRGSCSGSFLLQFYNDFDTTGDDVGGAKTPVDVPVVWAGSRQLGSEEGQSACDSFNKSENWNGIATDPWHTTTIVPNLKPGNWNLSVTVNGQLFTCQSVIALPPAGPQVIVTFQVSKETGQFTGCVVEGGG